MAHCDNLLTQEMENVLQLYPCERKIANEICLISQLFFFQTAMRLEWDLESLLLLRYFLSWETDRHNLIVTTCLKLYSRLPRYQSLQSVQSLMQSFHPTNNRGTDINMNSNIHHVAKTSITITILFILRFGGFSKILTDNTFYLFICFFVCFALYSMYVILIYTMS